MDRAGGWMHGGAGGAEWIWVVAATLAVVLLAVVIAKLFNTKA